MLSHIHIQVKIITLLTSNILHQQTTHRIISQKHSPVAKCNNILGSGQLSIPLISNILQATPVTIALSVQIMITPYVDESIDAKCILFV